MCLFNIVDLPDGAKPPPKVITILLIDDLLAFLSLIFISVVFFEYYWILFLFGCSSL